MAAFVIDASVVAVWFLPDEDHEIAETAMDRLISEAALAPGLLIHELRSLLLTAEKRQRITSDDVAYIPHSPSPTADQNRRRW